MFATIDIGTNSVLLLVGNVSPEGKVKVVHDLMTITRLGRGLSATGKISEDAMERTFNAIGKYFEICSGSGVSRIEAIGTAVLRNASNAADFLSRVKAKFDMDVEVVSGEREARLAYEANSPDFGNEILVADIGGGSTEFVTIPVGGGTEGKRIEFKSLQIGCVSLTEKFLKNDPPLDGEVADLQKDVRHALESGLDPKIFARPHDRTFVAASGTATTLAAMEMKLDPYEPARVHGMKMKITTLRDIINDVRKKDIEERKKIPGLIPARADVIFSGLCILHEVMVFLGHADLIVSDHGVRWGLFYEKYCG